MFIICYQTEKKHVGTLATCQKQNGSHFYRAMHFSAKRGIANACRLSVRLSVRL